MRKTKIIATLGPSSSDKNILTAMVKAGMNVARINMSHATHEEHAARIALIKEIRRDLSAPVALMLDTRGPEIRLGTFENGSADVVTGDEFEIVNEKIVGDAHKASVSCSDFYKMLRPGDFLLINDGLIRMQVKSIENKVVKLQVVIGGTLSNHKSINVPGAELDLPYLSDKDREDLLFSIEQDVDFIAASFVSTANDIRVLKDFLFANGGENIEVIAKIESRKGVENIDDILSLADGIMVARGDLGVEVPFIELPAIQKSLIKHARAAGKRVITATEMLESMISKPRPTRAETSDVANAVYDGTGAIMLSGETAAGLYPVQAIKVMSDIAEYTEKSIHYRKRFNMYGDFDVKSISDALSASAVKASYDLDCNAIVVATRSGRTAKLVSRFRPACPIIAVTTTDKAYYQLALSWGVYPLHGAEQAEMGKVFSHAAKVATYFNMIKTGDTVVTLATSTGESRDAMNVLRIDRI